MPFGWDGPPPAFAPFEFHNPTRVVFGAGTLARLGGLVPPGARVALLSGGGAIRANGTHARVVELLGDRLVLDCGGITPNPALEQLLPITAQVRAARADFLLAVGGGSVIDGAKFVAAAVPFAGDPWAILAEGAPLAAALPLATVLTLPGTGSEMNRWSVISRHDTREKLAFGDPLVSPVFSILDPELTLTLPPRQVVNGVIDAFVHVLEQYLTYPVDAPLQDRMAEAILHTLLDEGRRTVAEPRDLAARANVMWCATMALNGVIAVGVPEDWATHTIGHELTALHGLDHAVTLAIVLPALLEHQRGAKFGKLLQYAERIWGFTEGTLEDRVTQAISRTRGFFEGFGVGTRLREHGIFEAEALAATIAGRLAERGVTTLGERGGLTLDGVRAIVRHCA